jgi:hypothetical protein
MTEGRGESEWCSHHNQQRTYCNHAEVTGRGQARSTTPEAWWPGGPLCAKTEPHAEHYAAQRVGGVLWRDGMCKGVKEADNA